MEPTSDAADLPLCPWCLELAVGDHDRRCTALDLHLINERSAMDRAERERSDPLRERRRTFGDWWSTHPELADLDTPTGDDDLPGPF